MHSYERGLFFVGIRCKERTIYLYVHISEQRTRNSHISIMFTSHQNIEDSVTPIHPFEQILKGMFKYTYTNLEARLLGI